MPQAFDPENHAWETEYAQLKEALEDFEYTDARSSVLNAHYTSPTVIKAIYEAVGNLGFTSGNILEITTLDKIQSQVAEKPNKVA